MSRRNRVFVLFYPPEVHYIRCLCKQRKLYSLFILDIPLIGIKELGVDGDLTLNFSSKEWVLYESNTKKTIPILSIRGGRFGCFPGCCKLYHILSQGC